MIPAAACTRRCRADWPAECGAHRPFLAPSCPVPHARITPWISSPSRRASSKRFNTTATAASPSTHPFASAANGRHWPVGDRSPRPAIAARWSSPALTCTAPTSATSVAPVARAPQASSSAVKEEVHAVSTARHGPRQLSR